MSFRCGAMLSDGFCGEVAEWRAEWSDRDMFTCDVHRDDARWAHDNDHSYDATGIQWTGSDGSYDYELRKDLPLKS